LRYFLTGASHSPRLWSLKAVKNSQKRALLIQGSFFIFIVMSSRTFLATLSRYFPPNATSYCLKLWEEKPFDITVTKKRNTKLGDYSYSGKEKRHKITINGDLNPYSFLVTYIHEVAHFRSYLEHSFRIKPHGEEWKRIFTCLMLPMLNEEIFPSTMLPALKNYFSNPKASSCSDLKLLKALKMQDEKDKGVFLGDIPIGSKFIFSGRIFLREGKRRTRSLCKEVLSGKKYYISEGAVVEIVSSTAA
jgi:hypothetical protein